MKSLALALIAGSVCAALPAAASECDAAFEASELQLRASDTHLLRARDSLRACALPACQSWMVDDCTKRLVEVEGRIPSVVFSAADGHGAPLYDVRVVEGDHDLAAKIDGRAVEMEPGPHSLTAERNGARVSLDVVVIEGKKAQQVVFAFPAPPEPEVVPAPVPRPAPGPERLAHPWARPTAVALLAGGVVATGIGVGFGVAAIAKKNDAHCNDQDVCRGSFDGALDDAHASTVGFIIGAVLAAAGVTTYFVFGRTHVSAMPRGIAMRW